MQRSYEKAFSYYRRAADLGSAEAGEMIYFGREKCVDTQKAITFYKKAAAGGHAMAYFRLGKIFDARDDGGLRVLNAAASAYLKVAELGLSEAQYKTAKRYRDGTGVPQSLIAAERWYRQAAENGFLKAQIELAGIQHRKKDYAAAAKWYKASAYNRIRPIDEAKIALARLFEGDQLAPADFHKAFAIYSTLMERNPEARYKIGILTLNGNRAPRDEQLAVQHLRRADEMGSRKARTAIGLPYEFGLAGLQKDEQLALQKFQSAADGQDSSADPEAFYHIGRYHLFGSCKK